MNIFYLDDCPVEAAKMHCDKHVVKMVLETAQLLSTAHRLNGNDDDRLYKPTHKNHPSAVWARESKANYMWLYDLFISLCDEYTYRYSKTHLTDTKLRHVLRHVPDLEEAEFTEPPQCMPDDYKSSNTVEAYQQYYLNDKTRMLRWTNRSKPKWVEEYQT